MLQYSVLTRLLPHGLLCSRRSTRRGARFRGAVALAGVVCLAVTLLAASSSPAQAQEDEEQCWESYELGEDVDDDGTTQKCLLHLDDVEDWLDANLLTVDTRYQSRDSYISELHDEILARCEEKRSESECSNPDHDVRSGYLYALRSGTEQLDDGRDSELFIIRWAERRIDGWHNQERYTREGVPSDTGSFYVWKPAVTPAQRDSDATPIRRSPSRAPSRPPANAEWLDGGLPDGSGTSADQYAITDHGTYRRKLQSNGTYRCYFNGPDDSLANLGSC